MTRISVPCHLPSLSTTPWSAGGRLVPLRTWWDKLHDRGPDFGYFLNPAKSVLVVKPDDYDEAVQLFDGTGIHITATGNRYLGSAIGTPAFVEDYVHEKARDWCGQVESLTSTALPQPQAAYSAFTRGLSSRRSFLCRVLESASAGLASLERVIATKLLPALTGQEISSELRTLFSFPCRNGGLGILDPTSLSAQYQSSRAITAPMVANILTQSFNLGDSLAEVASLKASNRKDVKAAATEALRQFTARASSALQHSINLGSEAGASSWLTCRPLSRHGFSLSKCEFRDGLALRYGWHPARLPSTCVCGATFSVEHALSCPTGGFPTLRHNEVRDIIAGQLKKVAHSVEVELHLQPVTSELFRYRTASTEDQARLDVAASGVWGGRFERVYPDVRVFNPFAPSNRSSSLAARYQSHEREKRRRYGQRVQEVERASFVPVVFSATGGAGRAASALLKRIAALSAEKSGEPYAMVMALLRCRLGFGLLRASVTYLRGARRMRIVNDQSAVLANAEAALI